MVTKPCFSGGRSGSLRLDETGGCAGLRMKWRGWGTVSREVDGSLPAVSEEADGYRVRFRSDGDAIVPTRFDYR